MRSLAISLLLYECILLLVSAATNEQSVVKLSLVIPDGHKVTDVHLRFERLRDKTEGSFEGEGEDDQEEGPSLGRGAVNAGKADASPGNSRHREAVETFSGSPKKPEESHNTIDRLIRLPRRKQAVVSIRK